MHDIDLGRDDDSQIDADTGGLTDFTSTFVVDWSQAPKEVIDGLQALEVNRRASDMVQVDNSVIPDVERIEQHAGDDEDVERIELESADEVINRDSKIGFKILTEAEKIKESVDWKTEHEEVQNVMKNLRAHRRRYLAIFILGPLVLLFLIVLVTGPLVFKHYMYFGEWTGTFGDPRGASLAVDVDLERSGNKLSGELVFLPIAGEVPDKSQVPMSMLSFYTGDPIPVYGGFTANSVTLNLVTDPKHTDKVMTFNLVATNDRGELSGFVELANKSMLQIKLTRL